MNAAPDALFRTESGAQDFAFDEKVVRVFDDMVSRSVPFYTEIQAMLADLVHELLPEDGGCVVDLGCSTGTTLDLVLAHPACRPGTHAVGIDNAPPMLEQAKRRLHRAIAEERLRLQYGDLNAELDLPTTNIVLMNWTLQFVRPIHRESVLRQVQSSLKPGGALLLSEKVLVDDSLLNRLYIELYYRFKGRAGYSSEEIQRKREALENVLVPYRVDENVELLKRCGFATVDTYFRWFNWAAFIATKPS